MAHVRISTTQQVSFLTRPGNSGKRSLQAHKHTETLHSATFSPRRQDACACHSATYYVFLSGRPPPFLSKKPRVDRLPAGQYKGHPTVTITSLGTALLVQYPTTTNTTSLLGNTNFISLSRYTTKLNHEKTIRYHPNALHNLRQQSTIWSHFEVAQPTHDQA